MCSRVTSCGLLLALFTALCASSAVPASPSCKIHEGLHYRHFTCRNFHSVEDFQQIVHDTHSEKPTWFSLWDSEVSKIPGGCLQGPQRVSAGAQTCHRRTFRAGRRRGKPVPRPRANSPQAYVQPGHTADLVVHPRSPGALGRVETHPLQGHAPQQRFQQPSQESGNSLHCRWSWLPNPAPHFTTLDLPTNKLVSFPANLDDGLPELKYVSVERNLITTVHEEDLAPLKGKPVFVDLMFNPVHCDCKLAFILDYPTRWHYFLCATPGNVADSYITHLTEEQLQCEQGNA
ncbi:hypothetical protein MRX96_022681 [Rhipicephalus microplus]